MKKSMQASGLPALFAFRACSVSPRPEGRKAPATSAMPASHASFEARHSGAVGRAIRAAAVPARLRDGASLSTRFYRGRASSDSASRRARPSRAEAAPSISIAALARTIDSGGMANPAIAPS